MKTKQIFAILTVSVSMLLLSNLSVMASSEHPNKKQINAVAGGNPPSHKTETPIDNRTVKINMLDSMVTALYDNKTMGSFNDFLNDFINIDSVDVNVEDGMKQDSIYKRRLDLMMSVIRLPYNEIVRKYINVYTQSNRMGRLLGLGLYYMPIFEEELFKQGLPTELKILPIIESALHPSAISPAGAAGLWQFMYSSGKMYGLKVNSFIDDRFDPIASTQAACRFLKDLYNIYGDWTLVLAAYNCGPGNVNKALKRVKDAKSYWDIYYLLPKETRGYVPAFIGATYAYTYHKAHDIEIAMPQHPIVTDTVHISNKVVHFGQIASTINVPIETLRALNPRYKLDIVPALETSAHLVLPMNFISDYIDKEQDIYSKENKYLANYKNNDNLKSISSLKDGYLTHKVKKGEVLGSIAKKYKVSTNNLMKWNNIKNAKYLKIGQRLKIYM